MVALHHIRDKTKVLPMIDHNIRQEIKITLEGDL
jgi:hypothetical protein